MAEIDRTVCQRPLERCVYGVSIDILDRLAVALSVEAATCYSEPSRTVKVKRRPSRMINPSTDCASRAQLGERTAVTLARLYPPIRIYGSAGKSQNVETLKGVKPCNRIDGCTALLNSGGALQQLLGLAFEVKARVLMGLGAGQRGDALHEIENALGFPIFLRQHCLDDFRRLGLGKTPLAQEAFAVLIGASDDPLRAALIPATNGAG